MRELFFSKKKLFEIWESFPEKLDPFAIIYSEGFNLFLGQI